jgi:hypothetical protein
VKIRAIAIVLTSMASSLASGAPACSSPAHRQFEFWIGDWRVLRPDGSVAGTNHITLEYGGCVVHEHYVTGKGYSGESLNVYDASRKVWHQSWVDTDGLLLILEGHWNGKSMALEGRAPDANGKIVRQRITWTPNTDGSVRQLWESADDTGAWTVVFDGKYTKN